MSVAVCPPGFDCAYANSCPSPILDCPPGFFCSSYAGNKEQDELDFSYALYKTQFDDVGEDITKKNAVKYIDPDRAIQNGCLVGFYCPNATTILPCTDGHWCPERTVVPHECDPLSICGERAQYQINFIDPVVMAFLVIVFLTASFVLSGNQKKRNADSNKKDPGARVASPVDENQHSLVPTKETDDSDKLFEASFTNVLCTIPNSKHVILPGVSGTIPAGKLSALMGPTASGKSTLINILRQGKLPSSTKGAVSYTIRGSSSNQSLTASQAQPYIGHVPQEDILDRQLTIRELFTFHAKARSLHHGHKSNEEIQRMVDEVLADLSIQHVADSIIGGGENAAANISGGQLKRVNIGCELVALPKPALLLLDEPTAGLDAAIAFELIQTLESLKTRGVTIFMIIQQPRAEIFEKIDHLFLMNSVGGIVYEGPSSQAVPYLWQLGYSPNPEASDADYCLDVLNGLRDPSSSSSKKWELPVVNDETTDGHIELRVNSNDVNNASSSNKVIPVAANLDCTTLHLLWQQNRMSFLPQHLVDMENPAQTTVSLTEKGDKTFTDLTPAGKQSPPPLSTEDETPLWSLLTSRHAWDMLLRHTLLNAERFIVIRLRNRTSLLVYMAINSIMAIALSSGFTIFLNTTYRGIFLPSVDRILQAYFPSSLQRYASYNVSTIGFAQLLFFMSSALGASAALSSVPVFSGQASLARREHYSGISIFSFTMGRILGNLLFVLLNGCVFAGVWLLFGHAGHYYDWWAVILSTSFAASGIGYISSASYKQSTASTWAIVAAFVCSVFAGVEPSLTQVSRYPVVSWPWYCNYATWTAEATYYTWTKYLVNDGHVPIPLQDGADMYGYEVTQASGIARSVGAMIAIGVSMRFVAAFMMYRRVTKH